MTTLPVEGIARDALLAKLEGFRADDVKWRTGRAYGYVYDAGREVEEVAKLAHGLFLTENALDPMVFPSLQRLEVEVVSMAAAHLGGDERTAGSFTSGGTESILLAVKTARDHARRTRGVTEPEIVAPVTAHAAFHKAAHYFGLSLISVDVDPRTFKADVDAMRRAITPRTVLLVGSAPSWAHGVVDPIPELGQVALDAGLLLHVDACVGGFLLPYFRRLGAAVPEFDLRVPGVTSISMDLHKFAFAPKGASIVLHRSRELRRDQLFGCSRWPGYIVVNPTVQSSKSGGPVAAAWAVMNFLGDEGYMALARRTLEGTRRLARGIEAISGLELMCEPEFSLVAATSRRASVFRLVDDMKARGWDLHAHPAYGASRENLHFLVTPGNAQHVDAMVEDLRDATALSAAAPPAGELAAAVGDLLATLGPGRPDSAALGQLLAMAGAGGGRRPGRMAEVNEVLNALPPEVRGELAIEFFNDLYMSRG